MKIDHSAFLYMQPSKNSEGKKDQFAQCGTCRFFNDEQEKCSLFGNGYIVLAEDTCGLYANGKPSKDLEIPEKGSVSPDEAGFEAREVRCENCKSFNAEESICELYKFLNEKHKDLFDLDENVDKFGCCNANTPKEK